MNASDLRALAQLADDWRTRHGYHGRGVVVVSSGGVVSSWVDELRNPEHWVPGALAIDEVGACWQATGGNDIDGATWWRPLGEGVVA